MECPCGSTNSFEKCCGPFLNHEALPETAEQLMRSRYTAYTRADISYIEKTLAPETKSDFDVKSSLKWAQQSKWKGLKIISTEKGGVADQKGVVEFNATYELDGKVMEHHEVSTFRKDTKGRWLFIDGDSHTHNAGEGHHHHEKTKPVVRETAKVGRNDPCPCGSGKKNKKCCGA